MEVSSEGTSPGECIDPMRRDYRGREADDGVAKEIVEGDMDDIRRADVVLVDFDKPRRDGDGGVVCEARMEVVLLESHIRQSVRAPADAPLRLRGRQHRCCPVFSLMVHYHGLPITPMTAAVEGAMPAMRSSRMPTVTNSLLLWSLA